MQVSKRLGPVDLAKVVKKLGLRGVLNLAAHILSRTADGVRAHAARLDPGHQHSHHQPQADATVDIVDEEPHLIHSNVGADLQDTSSSNSDSSRRQGGRLPGVALVAALLQLLLLALAGEAEQAGC